MGATAAGGPFAEDGVVVVGECLNTSDSVDSRKVVKNISPLGFILVSIEFTDYSQRNRT